MTPRALKSVKLSLRTGVSLRGAKITFLSITFEILIQSLHNKTKVWQSQDLSFDIKIFEICAVVVEKIKFQGFY